MIKTVKIDLTAGEPNLPLARSCVFAASAASFTLVNVPRAVGQRAITGVSLIAKNVSGTTVSRSAVRVGSAWEVTVPASHFATVGTVTNGIRVVAAGKDENGASASWVLGVGDLVVMDPSGTVTPGSTTHDVHREDFENVASLSNATLNQVTSKVNEILSILKPSAVALILALALPSLAALSPSTPFGDIPPTNTIGEVVSAAGGGGGSEFKRDLTNNVCVADSFTAWSATLPAAPSGDWESQPTFDTDNTEWLWYYTDWYADSGNSDPNATSVTFSFTVEGATTTFTATRSRVAYSNDTFTTYAFVTNAMAKAGGGTSTNAVSEIITNHVTSGYLATQAATLPITGGTMKGEITLGVGLYGRASIKSYDGNYSINHEGNAILHDVSINGLYGLTAGGIRIGYNDGGWGDILLKDSPNQTLPAYLASTAWHGSNKSFADYGISDFTNDVSAVVTNSALGLAYRADVTNVEATVSAWESYWKGDRVRLSVTNYYGNTSGELPRLRIEEFDHSVTNGSTVTNVYKIVWDEEARHTNYQAQVDAKVEGISNAVIVAAWKQTNTQLSDKAPRAWGTVTSAGAKAPNNTVWHTAPNTVFAGGTEYAHVAVGEGTISVLRDYGAPVYTEGEEGKFRFTDDSGTFYFGFDVTDGYTIGCRTDGISSPIQNPEDNHWLIDLTYDLTASDPPTILSTTNLSATAEWNEYPATWDTTTTPGVMVASLDLGTTPPSQRFFKAKISVSSTAKFITNMQADLAGGIAASNEVEHVIQNVYPVITSTGVVWRVKN